MQELGALGVRRISVGSALSRAALGAVVRAAQEIRDHGTFTFGAAAIPYAEADAMMTPPPASEAGSDPAP